MMRSNTILFFVALLALAQNAGADAFKCTDAHGNFSYTNSPCPPGYRSEKIGDNVSVIDGSEVRAMMAAEKDKAQAYSNSEAPQGTPAAGDVNASNLGKIQQAQSLIRTALAARDYMGMTAVIILCGAAFFLLLSRRRKAADPNLTIEIAKALKRTDG